MELGYNHSLRAIYHERPMVSHQRHLAQIDLLFSNILDLLLAAGGLLVIDDQSNQYTQRRGKRESAQLAFLYVENRLAEPIGHVLQLRAARVTNDRKHTLER